MHNYIAKLYSLPKDFIAKGHERSIKAKKNILLMLLIKGCNIGISIALVPIVINYVNPSRYGIWLTISSIVAWFRFFDIGLTQGLRNKFAEATANNDYSIAQVYVSTSYAILSIVFFIIWFLFLIGNNFLNWSNILKVSDNMQEEIQFLALIVITYFCLSFVLKGITTILTADQKPAKSSLIDLIGQFISFMTILFLVNTTEGSLINLGLALCIPPVLVLIVANILYFKGIYKQYCPVISKIRFTYSKQLFNLGIMFFLMSFAAVVQYESANIIIARLFGTEDVTSYNIVFKYFGVLNMIFVIFLTPFWSASTEAYIKNDLEWIKNGIKKYNLLNVIVFFLGVVMLIFSENIYSFWLGKTKVIIPFSLSFWGFIFFNVSIFGSKYVFFLNGISALRIQVVSSIISPFLYIVIAFILIKYYHMGIYSLFIASVVANFNAYLLAPLQYYQIVVKRKKGIWIR